jgi:hypothetical protein
MGAGASHAPAPSSRSRHHNHDATADPLRPERCRRSPRRPARGRGPRSEWRASAQQVTWNSPITLPFASFRVAITSGVGRSTTSHRLRARYSAASGESSTLPYCPAPMISVSAPSAWR